MSKAVMDCSKAAPRFFLDVNDIWIKFAQRQAVKTSSISPEKYYDDLFSGWGVRLRNDFCSAR